MLQLVTGISGAQRPKARHPYDRGGERYKPSEQDAGDPAYPELHSTRHDIQQRENAVFPPNAVIPGRALARTSDAQLRIGESRACRILLFRDSGFDASHRPGMTA
jgi:hypothetical protein